jgi:leader peptidase (prepilin peptidase)/N-methyltransferase
MALWLRDWPLMAALVAVTFIDLDLRIIPDEISLGGLTWGLVTAFLDPQLGWFGAFFGAALGFVVFYGFAWLYWFLTKRSGLGGGDIKLLAMLGAFVGVSGIFSTILVSSVLGSIFGVASALMDRRKSAAKRLQAQGPSDEGGVEIEQQDSVLRTAIPYGPFLVIGAIFFHLLGDAPWFPFTIPM